MKRDVPGCKCCGACTGTICAHVAPPSTQCGLPADYFATVSVNGHAVDSSGNVCFSVPGNQAITVRASRVVGQQVVQGTARVVTVGCDQTASVDLDGPDSSSCFCKNTPATLSLTATYGQGEDAHTYGNAYQSCSLAWYCSPPSYLPPSAYTGPAYYSTTFWVDDFGFIDYFRLSCFSTVYSLSIGQFSGGLWQNPGLIYSWTVAGGSGAVNFCSPFLLGVGGTQTGIFFNGKFVVSG